MGSRRSSCGVPQSQHLVIPLGSRPKKTNKRSELFKAQLSKKKPGSNALHSITLAPAKPLGLALTLALAHVTWPRSRPRRITLAPAKPLGLALTLALAQDTCGLGNVKQAF